MKKLFIMLCLPIVLFTNIYSAVAQNQSAIVINTNSNDPNQMLLPSPFPVYVQNGVVINNPQPGFSQAMLPTNNDYTAKPGCYVACYSHGAQHGIYRAGDNIYVNGQVRVAGNYNNRICIPTGYENQDISKAIKFKQLCSAKIKSCANNNCWAGGDTGGWFGIQASE